MVKQEIDERNRRNETIAKSKGNGSLQKDRQTDTNTYRIARLQKKLNVSLT